MIDSALRLKLHRSMLDARFLEKRAYDLFMQNLVKGTSHLALGQEAIASGFGMAMRHDENLTSVTHGVLGSYAIIGAHLPIAAGAAWSAQYRKSGQVAVCFFGDGTTNIGAFHKALNFAAVWKLPVMFVCENNHYMEYTPIADVTAVARPAADRASAYGLEAIVIDGIRKRAVVIESAHHKF